MATSSIKFRLSWLIAAVALAAGAAAPSPAWAAKFANQFIEFELPPQWQCNLEAAEWVCQSVNEAKKREAIIVLAAKLKGEQDTLDKYTAHLKNAKSYNSVQGKPVTADVKYVKQINVNAQDWVDSLHLSSELPGYYTRYLGTVKNDIAVLLTYSIVQDKYQSYMNQFEDLVSTIKVFRRAPAPAAAPGSPQGPMINIPSDAPNVFSPITPQGGKESKKTGNAGGASGVELFGFAGIAGLAGLFLLWRKRRG